jgi:hypothetical protein
VRFAVRFDVIAAGPPKHEFAVLDDCFVLVERHIAKISHVTTWLADPAAWRRSGIAPQYSPYRLESILT